MGAKYRIALSEVGIAKITQVLLEAKEYEYYVLFKKQLDRINGGMKTPDYAVAGVRSPENSNIMRTADNSFTIQDDSLCQVLPLRVMLPLKISSY